MKVKFVRDYNVKWGDKTLHFNRGEVDNVDNDLAKFIISSGIAIKETKVSKKKAIQESPENKVLNLEETEVYEVKEND